MSVSPTNSRGPMPESGSAAQTCHSVLLTWVVSHTRSAISHVSMILILYVQKTTEMYAKTVLKTQQQQNVNSCFLRLLAKGTSKLCEVGRDPPFSCLTHWGSLHVLYSTPKVSSRRCEDVDGNDVGLCVAVLSRLGSRNLNAPGTSLLSDRTHTRTITSN